MKNKFEAGKRIKELRNLKGIKQEDLANYLGISRTTLSKYEQGLSSFDFETFDKILVFFNLTYDEFYQIENKEKNTGEKVKIKNSKSFILENLNLILPLITFFISIIMIIVLFIFAYLHPIYIEEKQSFSYLWRFILLNKTECILFNTFFYFFILSFIISLFFLIKGGIYDKTKK